MLDKSQIGLLMEEAGAELEPHEVDEVFATVDQDGGGDVRSPDSPPLCAPAPAARPRSWIFAWPRLTRSPCSGRLCGVCGMDDEHERHCEQAAARVKLQGAGRAGPGRLYQRG